MRHLLVSAVALCCIAVPGIAQEKLPPRFEPLVKNERLRLIRVLGMPELQPSVLPTSAISGDGKWAIHAEDLSSGDADNPTLRTRLLLFDLQAKTWPREFEIDGKSVSALDLSHDGGKVLLAAQFIATKDKKEPNPSRGCLILFDLRAGKAIRIIETVEHRFACIALTPDESAALAGSWERLQQWDLKSGKHVAVYDPKAAHPALSVAYLPGGKQFVAGYYSGEVRLWNAGPAKLVRTFSIKNVTSPITELAVSRDGKRFAAGDVQGAVTLWDLAAEKEVARLQADKRPAEEFIAGLTLSDDSKTILAAWGKENPGADDASGRLVAWDAETKKPLWSKIIGYRGRLPMFVKGDKLLVGGGPNLLETWSIKDGTKLDSRGAHTGPVNALAVLKNGDIKSAGVEGVLMTWRNGQFADRDAVHQGAITALAVNKNRERWLSAGADLLIRHGPRDAVKKAQFPKAHTGAITSLAFSADGNWAASGAGDRTAVTWDLEARKVIASFAGHSEGVNAVAISPDDRWLATGSDDTTIRIWPINAGKLDLDREAITLEGHKKAVTCLAFSPDGKTLLSGSQDQTLKVWDWPKEKAVRTIPGHKNWITSLLVVDAKTAVTTSDDLTLRWWDLDAGKEIGKLDFGVIGDCPRCLARLGPDRVLVGSSSWLIYELQMLQTGKGAGSSK